MPRTRYLPLSELRKLFVDSLVGQLERYFPEGSYAMFDVLVPTSLPKTTGEVATYVPEIMDLADRFDYDRIATAEQFRDALIDMIEVDYYTYCAHKDHDNAAEFWSFILRSKTVIIGQLFRSLMEIVLVLPVGSEDAERGFSIMKHAKYDRRNRLTPDHLDDILRIRINGPPIESFDAPRYALIWQKDHMASEDTTGIKKKANEKRTKKSYLRISELF